MEQQRKASSDLRTRQYSLGWPVLTGIAIPLVWIFVAAFLPKDSVLLNPRLDSIFDELGAFILFTVSILIILLNREEGLSFDMALTGGLLAIGFIRALNSMTEDFQCGAWLKRLEGLSVGFVFALGWPPTSFFRSGRLRSVLSGIFLFACVVLSILVFIKPHAFPTVLQGANFSAVANSLGLFSGFLCLAAVANALRRGIQHSADELIFLNFCFSYGMVGLCLPWVGMWQLRWWAVQAILLTSYLFCFLYVFIMFRRLQSERVDANRKLHASNVELENFAYIASHDLEEPLRMITSYLRLLKRQYRERLDAQADELIGFAVDGATRMKGLLHELLALSRVSRAPLFSEPVDSAQVVERVLRNLDDSIRRNAARIDCGPLPAVVGSPIQIEQVFQNLLSNALKFRTEAPPRIRIYCRWSPRYSQWLFTVVDNGIGFDMKDSERVFLIFQRLQGKGGPSGSGIGLALCRRIIERHGGRIWTESVPGQGSAFHFTLPGDAGNALRKPRRVVSEEIGLPSKLIEGDRFGC